MKRIMAIAMLALMGGCQVAQDVKNGIADAPVTFWDNIKDVAMFIGQLVINVLTGWLQALFG